MSFIRALLQPDPAKRPTAEQALEHPFLAKVFRSVSPESMPPPIKKLSRPETTLDCGLRAACLKLMQKRLQEWGSNLE
jgi:serine/threonine protein kinase